MIDEKSEEDLLRRGCTVASFVWTLESIRTVELNHMIAILDASNDMMRTDHRLIVVVIRFY